MAARWTARSSLPRGSLWGQGTSTVTVIVGTWAASVTSRLWSEPPCLLSSSAPNRPARSRRQGGAPHRTNDLDAGEDRQSVAREEERTLIHRCRPGDATLPRFAA